MLSYYEADKIKYYSKITARLFDNKINKVKYCYLKFQKNGKGKE